MTLLLRPFEEIYVTAQWDMLFDQAIRNQGLMGLIEDIRQLPDSIEQKVRILMCEYALHKQTQEPDAEKRKARLQEILRGFEPLGLNLLAQGVKLSIRVDETPLEEMDALMQEAEQLRLKMKKTGVFATDQEGAGRFAYSMASGYIMLCNEERALEELDTAARYYGGLDHDTLMVRLEYQKLRLCFVLGEYRNVLNRSPRILSMAEQKISALCDCITEYRYWSALLTGERSDGVHPGQLFDLFYQNQVVTVDYPQDTYLQSVIQLYLSAVNVVNDVHKMFPLYHRNANLDHVKTNLERVTQLAADLVTDEVALFVSQVCQGIAEVYSMAKPKIVEGCCRTEEKEDVVGLERLLKLDQPFIEKSAVLKILRAAAVVEALVLTPQNALQAAAQAQMDNLAGLHNLGAAEKAFVCAWMRNLCPHALWLTVPDQCTGMLHVTASAYRKVGAENTKLSGFPLKNMCENMLGVLFGISLTRSQCVNAAKHENFMVQHGIDRVIYQSFIQAFEERYSRGGPTP